ncbi:MAG: hypothetical protein ACP5HK_02995 [Acidilobus sp.]
MPAESPSVLIHLENMRVSVDGRLYENPHVIILGASHLSGEIAPGLVRVDAKFNGYPKVEQGEEALKIGTGGDFMADITGVGITSISELEEGYIIEGLRVTVRFEVDEQAEKVVVKVPRVGTIKAERLTLNLDKETSANIILSPFVLGAMTLSGPVKLRVTVSGDRVSIYTSEGGAEDRKVEIRKAAAERASS